MILKRHPSNNGEYIVYVEINGEMKSVGSFFGKSQAKNYAMKYYNDYTVEKVIE